MKRSFISIGLAMAVGVFGGLADAVWAAEYEVTITNLTRGQTFTPILVASHKRGVRLFEPGQPASVELEMLAEGGATDPLQATLEAMSDVREVANSGAPLPPGMSVTVSVATGDGFRYVSVASMLVPTNDGFFAANGVRGPRGNRTVTLRVPAYDAGTEANDEDCAHIPTGGGCGGEGFNTDRDGEGYVHVHAGFHGVGPTLSEAGYDWRNPVAEIKIQQVR